MKYLARLLICCASASCVDTSREGGVTGGPIAIAPATWTTRPGKAQEFVAEDTQDPTAPIEWTLPDEVDMIEMSGDGQSIWVASKGAIADVKLEAHNLNQVDRSSDADIKIVDFGFGFQLAQQGQFGGQSNHFPSADIALSRRRNSLALGPTIFLFLGYYNTISSENYVKVFDPTFMNAPLATNLTANYDVEYPARITADANGFGYWIDRADNVNRIDVLGTTVPIALSNLGNVAGCPVQGAMNGTDIASNDDGDLYLFLECGTSPPSTPLARVSRLFTGTPVVKLLPHVSNPTETELVVDERGRLLFNEGPILKRITDEDTPTITVVRDLTELFVGVSGLDVIDVEVDAEGAIYVEVFVAFGTAEPDNLVLILNSFGTLVKTISEVLTNPPIPFEDLEGLGVSPEGELRLLHDFTTAQNPDDQAAQAFAISVGAAPGK